MLGPFGELLTEAELQQLERAAESLRLRRRRRGEAYRGELRRLARELRALLPAPLLSITVRSPPPAPGQPLPLWGGRLAGAVSSLAALLAHAEGARVASPAAAAAAPLPGAVRGEGRGGAGRRREPVAGALHAGLWPHPGAGAGHATTRSPEPRSCPSCWSWPPWSRSPTGTCAVPKIRILSPGVRKSRLTHRVEVFVCFMSAQRWALGGNSTKLAHPVNTR